VGAPAGAERAATPVVGEEGDAGVGDELGGATEDVAAPCGEATIMLPMAGGGKDRAGGHAGRLRGRQRKGSGEPRRMRQGVSRVKPATRAAAIR
jgi:hypothetical protein